jgi:hypothetical protein
MRISFIILSFILFIQTCYFQNSNSLPSIKKESTPKNIKPIDFDKEIKPIFVKNCSPCHFPGGKMYTKLPFDKDTTIINHSAGILKRIKNEEENTLLKNFIAQNKNGLPEDKP